MTYEWEQFDRYAVILDGYDIGAKRPEDYTLVQFLGMIGELGEVCEKIKKAKRDGTLLDGRDLALEFGDMLYYYTRLLKLFDIDFSSVVRMNLTKLEDRRQRNVLSGKGDHR